MTLEQLHIFLSVAERQHLTKGAAAIGLTPSAVSASIKALEASFNVRLFERVGRGIELTQAGRLLVGEAKAILSRANATELLLSEFGGLKRGTLSVCASQTIASYWLPQRLMLFHRAYPEITVKMAVGNTRTAAQAVLDGTAEIGFIEGTIDEPALLSTLLAYDQLVIVLDARHPLARQTAENLKGALLETSWIMREEGSGTRSQFEAALAALSIDTKALKIALTLPSNEAILSALPESGCAAALSRTAAAPLIDAGRLRAVDIEIPRRAFMSVKHKERGESAAARELRRICQTVPS